VKPKLTDKQTRIFKKVNDKSFEEMVSWRKKVGNNVTGNGVKWASIKGIPEMQRRF
jgi:hypothetical protein